jgi:hypothetical protein
MSEKNHKDSNGSPHSDDKFNNDKNHRVSNSSFTEDDIADIDQYSVVVGTVEEIKGNKISPNQDENNADVQESLVIEKDEKETAVALCQESVSANESNNTSPSPTGCCIIC